MTGRNARAAHPCAGILLARAACAFPTIGPDSPTSVSLNHQLPFYDIPCDRLPPASSPRNHDDARLQALGMKLVQDGKSIALAQNTLRAVQTLGSSKKRLLHQLSRFIIQSLRLKRLQSSRSLKTGSTLKSRSQPTSTRASARTKSASSSAPAVRRSVYGLPLAGQTQPT